MPRIDLSVNTEEELFYRRHVKEALGEEEGEFYLEQVDATRVKYGGLPATMEAQINDLMRMRK